MTSRRPSSSNASVKNAKAEGALPDIVAPGLRVLFVGINPGLQSARAHAHFANPRNAFWRALHQSALLPRLFAPEEQHEILQHGLGITNSVARVTRGSGELRAADFAGALERLTVLAAEQRPRWRAFVGKD